VRITDLINSMFKFFIFFLVLFVISVLDVVVFLLTCFVYCVLL
jgi:hypothetical protein